MMMKSARNNEMFRLVNIGFLINWNIRYAETEAIAITEELIREIYSFIGRNTEKSRMNN